MLKWKNENNIKIINEINLICSNNLELLIEKCLDKIINFLIPNNNYENEVKKNINENEIINKKYNLINNNISKDKLFDESKIQISKEIDIYYASKIILSGNEIKKEIIELDKFYEIILKKDNKKNYENFSQNINNISGLNYLYNIFEFLSNKNNEAGENVEEKDNYNLLKEYDELISSFNSKNEYSCFSCKKKIKKKNCQYCQKILDILDKNSKFMNYINNILYSLYNYIFSKRIFYIGIFGNKGSGKSIIFNNILGYDILTTNENECTKRGIIIEDGEEYALFKADIEKDYLKEKNFCIFRKKEKIITGQKNVKKMLELLNLNYAKNTNKNDWNYFILTLPIKFFDEINLEKNLRKIIKFIDLPGFNSNNEKISFEYEELLESISCFIINFKQTEINDLNNNIFDSFSKTLKNIIKQDSNIYSNNNFLKNCLFNINLYDNSPNKINLKDLEIKIKNLVNNINKNKNDDFDPNFIYINGLASQNYLNKKNLFSNYKYLLNHILKKYRNNSSTKTLIEYFCKVLKEYIIEIFKLDDNNCKDLINEKFNNELYIKMNELFENNFIYTGYIPKYDKNYSKILNEICSYLAYAHKNINNLEDYKISNINNFYDELKKQIDFINNIQIDNHKNLLIDFLDKFYVLFENKNNNIDEGKINFLFYKNFFDSFMAFFEKINLDLPPKAKEYKNLFNKIEAYYKTILRVEKYEDGSLEGNCKSFDWNNGICEKNKQLQIYEKKFERKCDGKFLLVNCLEINENFDDIIVGWKIVSRWRDGTNGSWKLQENPLLKKNINCIFKSKRFRGERFDIYVYLMKFPI